MGLYSNKSISISKKPFDFINFTWFLKTIEFLFFVLGTVKSSEKQKSYSVEQGSVFLLCELIGGLKYQKSEACFLFSRTFLVRKIKKQGHFFVILNVKRSNITVIPLPTDTN